MTSAQWLTVAGLVLTIAGAATLAVRDVARYFSSRPRRGVSNQRDLTIGFHRPEAAPAFIVIAIGAALQIAGVAAG